jgi:GDP-mannose 4,6-dehydratase
MTKRALITGITGQDGSYLAELLLAKGYEVIGMVRRSSTLNFERIGHLQDDVELVPGDILDEVSMIHILRNYRPDEVYNLGAISFVAMSFNQAELTANVTGLGVLRLLEAIDQELAAAHIELAALINAPIGQVLIHLWTFKMPIFLHLWTFKMAILSFFI